LKTPLCFRFPDILIRKIAGENAEGRLLLWAIFFGLILSFLLRLDMSEIFVWESKHGWKVAEAWRDQHGFTVIQDGLTWQSAVEYAKRLRKSCELI